MKRSIFASLLILCFLLAGLGPPVVIRPEAALAAPDEDTVIVPSGSPIEIAALMTSIFTTTQDHLDAIDMAMDDFGLIKGFSVQRNDFLDDCDAFSGENMAGFITDNVQNVGVIGPICSNAAAGAAPVLNTFDVVMISPVNTAPDVYTFGPRVYNRVAVVDPLFDSWDFTVMNLITVQDWQTRFASIYGRAPDYIAKYVYDAAMLLLTRIDQVSQVDGGGNLVLSRTALETAVRTTYDFQGITGRVALDVHGNRVQIPQTLVEYDPFSATSLDSTWSWKDGEPTTWSLSAVPGFLQIYTQDAPVFLVQPTPQGDYEIRTYLDFTPTQNFQFGGLYLYFDEDNFMAFGRAFCDIAPPTCVGNGIYFDYIEGGAAPQSNFATAITSLSQVYLRVVAEGSNFTGYVSENGTEWTEIGTHTAPYTPQQVGLILRGSVVPSTPIPANFDFFILQFNASRMHLPLTFK